MTNTATDSWITAIVNHADELHRLILQGDPAGEVARVARRDMAVSEEAEEMDRALLESLGMKPEDVDAAIEAAKRQAAGEDQTRIWWATASPEESGEAEAP